MFTIYTLSNADCVTKLQSKGAAETTTQRCKQGHHCCERKQETDERVPELLTSLTGETEQLLDIQRGIFFPNILV